MLACMGAVALTLWQWPTATLRLHDAAHADVTLPAPQEVLIPVPALPPATPDPNRQPVASDRRVETATSRPPSRPHDTAPTLLTQSAPIVEPPDLALVGEDVSTGVVMPIASRTIVLPMRPVVPHHQPMPNARLESPGNAFAHAGMAIGSAFRRAGVNTGAAFSRIFE